MKITVNDIQLTWEKDQSMTLCANHVCWYALPKEAYLEHKQYGIILLSSATSIDLIEVSTGFGKGLQMTLSKFPQVPYVIILNISIHIAESYVDCSISVKHDDEQINTIHWPAPFKFDEPNHKHYTLLPHQQGLLLPNTWKTAFPNLPFHGQFCSSDAYMPWFSQFQHRSGYIAIALQPWDAGYHITHPENETFTHIGVYWLPSLKKMSHIRVLRYIFIKDGDYNTACSHYRDYVKEIGHFTSLREKAIRNPHIKDLIGCMFLHKGIKTHVSSESDFYDAKQPEKNNMLITFDQRREEINRYHQKGITKLYLHLDGWAQPGYDNAHPDYFPVCEEAGGVEGLQRLFDTIHQHHYLIGLHDQYRDFYHSAPSYSPDLAVVDAHGNIPSHKRWAGGKQSYLCSSIAPEFVKRNFTYLFQSGLYPDASYLDVFTCNEPDECHHPLHTLTRKESLYYREQCFSYLESKHILASSEEANDWAIRHLIFAHYGPYPSMMRAPDATKMGIDVPLFNLVYHDCIILPWPMDQLKNGEDQMLYALLNGGAPYLEKDGAYPNTDGVFESYHKHLTLEEKIERSKVVASLHELVALQPMLSHEFIDLNPKKQRTVFANGLQVTIDLENQTYQIEKR